MRLKNKVAIVTGAGAGIGKSIAEVFAKEGAKIVVASRRVSTEPPVVDDMVAQGTEAIFVECDVSVEKDVKKVFEKTIEKYGRVDILVNNAGVNFCKPFEETEPADWDRVINTDLRGTYLCSRCAILEMLKTGGGTIINIASTHSVACYVGAAPYDAAKWGMIGLTKSMAVEFADRNIRVNALSPGLTDTQIWIDIKKAAPDLDRCLDYWKANIPMGRPGTRGEIAYTAVFMASDEASYMTGANVLVDGGATSQLNSREPYNAKRLDGT
ncbi:SDR family NAD(P)-dependent oxidoreductase [Verrucomicrobiota bacterium]